MSFLSNITGNYQSSAKVVDGALVLSLPDAISPVVWRMELEDVKAASLEIETKDNVYTLVLKEGKGEKKEIAPFDNKTKALKALMATSRALENAHGVGKASANDSGNGAQAHHKKSGGSPIVSGLIGIIILGVLLFALSQIGPKTMTGENFQGQSGATSNAAPANNTAGVPLSADDFLRRQ